MTWASERTERARMVWDEALADAGVPRAPLRRLDVGLDSPQAVAGLPGAAGFVPRRVWPEQFRQQWDPESFWAFISGRGADRQRLNGIDDPLRSALMARLRRRLRSLGPEDYV